jgi:putrescine aminotransferase
MVGLMGALELVRDKTTLERFDKDLGAGNICRDHCVENGIVLRAVGNTMVCAPPFTLTHDEADELVEKAWRCLDLTQESLRRA